jgi:GTPase SAR1 family protein
MLSPRRLIAFAGPPGSGKSSLINGLLQRLPDASALSMDDFSGPETQASMQLDTWLDAGGDFNLMDISSFCDAMATLKTSKSPAEVAFIEAPLGRAHARSATMLDTLFWIDIPFDISMARNFLALYQQNTPPPPTWFQDYLTQYLQVTRRVFEHQRRVVRPGADHLLDGLLPLPRLVDAVLELIG